MSQVEILPGSKTGASDGSITQGVWFARSPEFVHSFLMELFVWLRVPGDIVFAVGVVALALFALRLLTGGKQREPALDSITPQERVLNRG